MVGGYAEIDYRHVWAYQVSVSILLDRAKDVVVASAYRGQGIGRTLLQRIIDFAGSKLSPIDLHLTSNPSRVEANALYQALGFEQRETNVYKMSL